MCLQHPTSTLSPEDIAISALTKMRSPSESQSASSKQTKKPVASKARKTKKIFDFPVAPTIVQSITPSRGQADHSYRDFSMIPPDEDYVPPTRIDEMTFAEKLQDILTRDEFKCITWMPHGRAFKIVVPLAFERQVCEEYFGHKRYSTFLRQLNNHGFKHITKGQDRNAYYHEGFLRDMPHLCKYMPDSKDARRQIPDPDNEPDLYEISRTFPLSGKDRVSGVNAVAVAVAIANDTVTNSFRRPRTASDLAWMVAQEPPAKKAAISNAHASFSNLNMLPQFHAPVGAAHNLVELAHTLRRDEILRKSAMVAALESRQALQQFTLANQANIINDLILRNMFR